jgi:hypothetical protein
MKKLILSLMLVSALPAFADNPVARQGADSVTLTPEPCAIEEVVSKIQPESLYLFYTAKIKLGGQDLLACWTEGKGMVQLFYQDGDQGAIPASEFKEEPWI